ncbi:MAG: hypothetical protein WA960_17070 [Tunicatimonas sp.]
MNENKAIIDLLAESLVKQDKLTEKVDLLASAMMDFKEIVASQGRSMEIIASMMQETRADIRDINYWLNKEGGFEREINDLKRRVTKLEKEDEEAS